MDRMCLVFFLLHLVFSNSQKLLGESLWNRQQYRMDTSDTRQYDFLHFEKYDLYNNILMYIKLDVFRFIRPF